MASERKGKPWQWALAAFVGLWGYGWALSHLSLGWQLFGLLAAGVAAVAFVLTGGLDAN